VILRQNLAASAAKYRQGTSSFRRPGRETSPIRGAEILRHRLIGKASSARYLEGGFTASLKYPSPPEILRRRGFGEVWRSRRSMQTAKKIFHGLYRLRRPDTEE
jgi:hypothetical protein